MSFLSTLFGRKKKKENVPISRPPEEPKTELPIPRGDSPITQQEKESKTELRVPEEAMLPPDTPLTLPKEPVQRETTVWKPGDVILDHYDVEDVITSGGMGTVYITSHRNWKVKIAIKSPNKEMLDHPSLFQMVVKEAEAWTDLGLHPNIAYCYFVRNIEEIPHIFVEYVDGGNLREWIEEGRCSDLKTGLDLAIQFCHGMAYAHSKGMIHKDIKPGNILMTKDGTLKVTDFGLVQRGDNEGASPILYTEPYASPEQMSDAPIVGPESDLYSFGVCLWEMFLGRRPRPNAWNNKPIPDPKTIDSSLPDALARLLTEMVSLDHNTRIALGGFDSLKEQFKTIYQNLFHEPSPHSELETADLRADGLNNRAISYLELGREDAAERSWQEALGADPLHLESTFNYAYIKWHRGEPFREAVEIPMNSLKHTHESNPDYWRCLALFHLFRGETDEIKNIQASKHRVSDPVFMKAYSDDEKPVGRLVRSFKGHEGGVSEVIFCPEGRDILSSGRDKTIRLWELESAREIRRFEGHTGRIFSLCVSADGKFFVSGSEDKTVRLWELATGNEIRRFEGHLEMIHCVSLSPDGRYILSASNDKTVRLWEVASGREIRLFEKHGDRVVTSVSFSPDGLHALSAGFDTTVKIWDIMDGKQLVQFTRHESGVCSAHFFPDGRHVLSGSSDEIWVWEAATGKEIKQLKGKLGYMPSLCLSPDGHYAMAVNEQTVWVWDVKSGRELRRYKVDGKYSYERCVAFSPDSRYAVSGNDDEQIRLWEIYYPEKQWAGIYPVPSRIKVSSLLVSEAVKVRQVLLSVKSLTEKGSFIDAYRLLREIQLLTGYAQDKEVMDTIVSIVTTARALRTGLRSAWNCLVFSKHTDRVRCVAFSPDSHHALSGSWDKTVRLWNIPRGKEIGHFKVPDRLIESACFSSDGHRIFSAAHAVRQWDIATEQEITKFSMKAEGDEKLFCLSADDHYVLSVNYTEHYKLKTHGEQQTYLVIWDVAKGEITKIFEGNPGSVHAVCFSPDGRYVLSGGFRIQLWEISTGRVIRRFDGHTEPVYSVCFSSDGRYILSGGGDKTVRFWEKETGKELNLFAGHSDIVKSVCFSPDGQYALTGSKDSTVRLLDVATGKELKRLEGHTDTVNSVCFSPDGRYALSGSDDNTARLWEFDWEWEFPEENNTDKGGQLS